MLPLSSSSTAPPARAHPSPPPLEVADIVRAYGAAFRAIPQVSHEQARVLWRSLSVGRQRWAGMSNAV